MSALRKYKRHLISARLLEAQTKEKLQKKMVDKLIEKLIDNLSPQK